MGKYENIREKIMMCPTAKDIPPDKLKSFLEHYGFVCKRANGSHFIYEYKDGGKPFVISIPMHNPVKPAYIDLIRKIIIEVEERE